MPERIALVVLGNGTTPYLDIKMDGKEYTVRCDEKGIPCVVSPGGKRSVTRYLPGDMGNSQIERRS